MKLIYSGNAINGSVEYSIDAGNTFVPITLAELKNGVELITNDLTKIQVRAGSNVFENISVLKKFKVVDEKLPVFSVEHGDLDINVYYSSSNGYPPNFKGKQIDNSKTVYCGYGSSNMVENLYHPEESCFAIISLVTPSNMFIAYDGQNFNIGFRNKNNNEITSNILCHDLDELRNAKNNYEVVIEYFNENTGPDVYKVIGSIDYEIGEEFEEIFDSAKLNDSEEN